MQADVTKGLLEIFANSTPAAPNLDDPRTLRYGILYCYDALFDLSSCKNVMLTAAQQSKLQPTMTMLLECGSRRAALSLGSSSCNWRWKPTHHIMKHIAEDAAESWVNPGVCDGRLPTKVS